MDAHAKSGEPALERRAILFQAPQPHPHRQGARLIGDLVCKQEDITIAARDKTLDAAISQPPILERIRPELRADPGPIVVLGTRCDGCHSRGGGDQ